MDKSIDWLYNAEKAGGGISAWRNPDGSYHTSYPEVTGYLIPTMIHWGAVDLAQRCANWLVSTQNTSGSWDGLDGIPRPFDTSAIIEGLLSYYNYSGDSKYYNSIQVAIEWMKRQIHKDGHLVNSPRLQKSEVYNLRASAIIHNEPELKYWRKTGLIHKNERTHYIAYALEGALNFDALDLARPHIELAYNSYQGLMPFSIDEHWNRASLDNDLCATAQMALLFHRVGLNARPYYHLLTKHVKADGGIYQSPTDKREIAWAVKFYLDLKEIMQ